MIFAEIEVLELNSDHLDEVVKIFNYHFGEGYLSKDQVCEYLNNSNAVSIVGYLENKILGVSIAVVDSLANTSKQLLKDQNWFLSKFNGSQKIALRKHMAVKPGYEGQGIGSLLVQESVKRLKNKSDNIITVVWKEGDGEIMDRLMTKNGFEVAKTIKDYWKKDSIEHEYICPECKKIPCSCSAIIYCL